MGGCHPGTLRDALRVKSPLFYGAFLVLIRLILLCIFISTIGFIFPNFIDLYGLSRRYLLGGDYMSLIVQVALFQFLHGSVLHLFMNSYFLYMA